MRTGIVAGIVFVAVAGCASTGTPKPKQPIFSDCLFRQTVDDWSPLDDQHLIIFGPGRQDAFLARIFFPTPDLMFNVGVAIVDDDRNGQICGGSTDGIVFGPRSTVPGKNNIASMRKIDKAQADELIALSRAKDKDGLASAIGAILNPAPLPST